MPSAAAAARTADERAKQMGLAYSLVTLAASVAYGLLALVWPGGAAAAVALGLLLGMVALWFIHCVTGDASAKAVSLFTFAYAFTFGAFALLLMPVPSDQMPNRNSEPASAGVSSEGALRLVRGCVREGAGGSRTLGSVLAPCPADTAASAPPPGILPTGFRYA